MLVTVKEINEIAVKVKHHVDVYKTFPTKIKECENIYSYGEYAYILTQYILNNQNDVDFKHVKNPSKTKGENVLGDKITLADYKDQCKRVINFINENGVFPNYIRTLHNVLLRPRDYIYSIAKIVVFYNEHNQLPNYVTVDSRVWKDYKEDKAHLYDYMTSTGCRGIGQCTSYYCAPNSLQQCFYRLTGIRVSESDIAKVAGTTSAGTSHQGIETAVAWFNRKYGKNIKLTWKNFNALGKDDNERWQKLQDYINNGAVFCHLLYRDQWGHYEVPQRVGGENIAILNSLGNSCSNGTYCGYIETRAKSTQKRYMQGISQKSIAILKRG